MKEALASLLLRLLASTWRVDREQLPHSAPGVIAFWHADMLPFWYAFARTNACAVTSLSKDGDILARLLNDWRYEVLRGSSSKGGKELLASMVEQAQTQMVLLTPDGPRGPAQVFKPGALICAQRAHVPLYFCKAEVSRTHIFEKSWDQFRLPLPFARITLSVVRCVEPSPDATSEELDGLLGELSEQPN